MITKFKLLDQIRVNGNNGLKVGKLTRLLDINHRVFPILWTLTFFLAILESFTYSGYAFKHLLLPLQLLIVLTLFSGILSILTPDVIKKEIDTQSLYRTFFVANKLIFLPIVACYVLVTSLELQHYPNYVYSSIHLQPNLFFWPTFLSIFLLTISFLDKGIVNFIGKVSASPKGISTVEHAVKFVLLRTAVVVFVTWMLVNNLQTLVPWVLERSVFMIRHPLASYDEKIRVSWGDFYNYVIFVKTNTPSDATIMYPPMKSPWDDVGNGGLIRYFLYPRILVQDIDDEFAKINSSADYVMVAWGFGGCLDKEISCHGWPKQKIVADRIIYKKANSIETETILENVTYDPSAAMNLGSWGIIKVKK